MIRAPTSATRSAAMRVASADYFMFLDDDDLLLPGALDAVRRKGHSGMPLMFKMDYRPEAIFSGKIIPIGRRSETCISFSRPSLSGRPGCCAGVTR